MCPNVKEANQMLADLYPQMFEGQRTGKAKYRISLHKGMGRLYYQPSEKSKEEIISYLTVTVATPQDAWIPKLLLQVMRNEHTNYLIALAF